MAHCVPDMLRVVSVVSISVGSTQTIMFLEKDVLKRGHPPKRGHLPKRRALKKES
jgi:hypothetical protein